MLTNAWPCECLTSHPQLGCSILMKSAISGEGRKRHKESPAYIRGDNYSGKCLAVKVFGKAYWLWRLVYLELKPDSAFSNLWDLPQIPALYILI